MGKNLVNCLNANTEYLPGDRVTGVCIQNEKFLKVRVGERTLVKIVFDPSKYTFTFRRKKGKTRIQKVEIDTEEPKTKHNRRNSRRKNIVIKAPEDKVTENINPLNGEMVEVLITNINGHKYYGEIIAVGV